MSTKLSTSLLLWGYSTSLIPFWFFSFFFTWEETFHCKSNGAAFSTATGKVCGGFLWLLCWCSAKDINPKFLQQAWNLQWGKITVTQQGNPGWNMLILWFLIMFDTDFRHQRSDAAADQQRKWEQLEQTKGNELSRNELSFQWDHIYRFYLAFPPPFLKADFRKDAALFGVPLGRRIRQEEMSNF